jgi:membrane fusion protein, hemolysin D
VPSPLEPAPGAAQPKPNVRKTLDTTLSVSQDAIAHDIPTPKDKDKGNTDGAESSSSEPKGQELTYAERVSLDQTQIQVDGALANLSAGMAITVEIKTGSGSPMSYLLSPVARHIHSMHKR